MEKIVENLAKSLMTGRGQFFYLIVVVLSSLQLGATNDAGWLLPLLFGGWALVATAILSLAEGPFEPLVVSGVLALCLMVSGYGLGATQSLTWFFALLFLMWALPYCWTQYVNPTNRKGRR